MQGWPRTMSREQRSGGLHKSSSCLTSGIQRWLRRTTTTKVSIPELLWCRIYIIYITNNLFNSAFRGRIHRLDWSMPMPRRFGLCATSQLDWFASSVPIEGNISVSSPFPLVVSCFPWSVDKWAKSCWEQQSNFSPWKSRFDWIKWRWYFGRMHTSAVNIAKA